IRFLRSFKSSSLLVPSPPCGGRSGWGVSQFVHCRTPPYPGPLPPGEREPVPDEPGEIPMGAGDASQFTRNTVKVGDLTIAYLKGGRGQPLLYLHGLSGWGRWESY